MAYIPPLSSAGIGSGLKVDEIVNKMMSLEQRPLNLLQAKVNSTETKISSFGQIKSAMSALYEAANGLMNLGTWRGKQFTSSDKGVATGTATNEAAAASFSLQVDSLAQGQSLASQPFASASTMGAAGEITLKKGRWNDAGTAFSAGSGEAIKISIASTDTLADVAAKITNSGSGITAVVVKGSSGDRLLVRSAETGGANGFSVSTQGGGSALASLAYDQSSVASGSATMKETAKAKDAEFTINGMAVTSASNTVADVVPGVTLNLLKTTTSPVDVSIGTDKDAIKGKVKAFQDAFNKVNSLLRNLSSFDEKSKSSQPLQGDSAVRDLQSALSSLTQQPMADGTTLASLGLEMKLDSSYRNPTLSLDEAKLNAALNDLPKLEKALTGDGTNPGLITRIRDFAFAANGVNGDITTRTKGLEASRKSNMDAMSAMELRLEQRQANMLKQYQALDAKMASMSSLSSFVSAQIGQWNKG